MRDTLLQALPVLCAGVVLSNPQDTKAVLAGTLEKDIDLFIPKPVWQTLHAQAMAQGFFLETKRQNASQVLFYRYRPETDQLLMIDSMWRIGFSVHGNYYALHPELEALCAQEARPHEASGLQHVSPAWRLFFIVCGMLLKGKSLKHYQTELQDYLDTDFSDFKHLLTRGDHLTEKEAEHLVSVLHGAPVSSKAKRSLLHTAFRRRPLAPWYIRATWLHLRSGNCYPPFIAVMGLDGTGKSTLSADTLERLPIKVRQHYWASRRMLLPTTRLHRRLERRYQKQDIRQPQAEYKPLPGTVPNTSRRHILKWIALRLLWINKYAEYWTKYGWLTIHRLCGTRIITDRYVYDEWMEYTDPLFRANRWLYRYGYPKPPILVITTASVDKVCQRRPSITPEQATHYLQAYEAIAEQMETAGVRVVRLSSEQAPAENLRTLLAQWLNADKAQGYICTADGS